MNLSPADSPLQAEPPSPPLHIPPTHSQRLGSGGLSPRPSSGRKQVGSGMEAGCLRLGPLPSLSGAPGAQGGDTDRGRREDRTLTEETRWARKRHRGRRARMSNRVSLKDPLADRPGCLWGLPAPLRAPKMGVRRTPPEQGGAGPAGSPANGKQLPLPTPAQPPGQGPARPDARSPSPRLGPGSGRPPRAKGDRAGRGWGLEGPEVGRGRQ